MWPVCDMGMQVKFLYRHLKMQHGMYQSQVIDKECLLEHDKQTFWD